MMIHDEDDDDHNDDVDKEELTIHLLITTTLLSRRHGIRVRNLETAYESNLIGSRAVAPTLFQTVSQTSNLL